MTEHDENRPVTPRTRTAKEFLQFLLDQKQEAENERNRAQGKIHVLLDTIDWVRAEYGVAEEDLKE